MLCSSTKTGYEYQALNRNMTQRSHIEEKSKLEPLLPQIKRIVGDNGLATSRNTKVPYMQSVENRQRRNHMTRSWFR